ncbi:hypothetical protein Pan216_38730 [Planctomycetes bacterium Pan216]|uniref:Uncharacterized protein n=1 Tax=Kolteria novifilia TaxID=2527975 RepID=A0A518B7P0_9BACT|nr:hypothetical protein Pan216_38730 [Planctomycetes bacterium Pan216]
MPRGRPIAPPCPRGRRGVSSFRPLPQSDGSSCWPTEVEWPQEAWKTRAPDAGKGALVGGSCSLCEPRLASNLGHPMRRRPTPLFPPLDKGGRKRFPLDKGGTEEIFSWTNTEKEGISSFRHLPQSDGSRCWPTEVEWPQEAWKTRAPDAGKGALVGGSCSLREPRLASNLGHPMRRRPTPLFPPLDKGGRKRFPLDKGGTEEIFSWTNTEKEGISSFRHLPQSDGSSCWPTEVEWPQEAWKTRAPDAGKGALVGGSCSLREPRLASNLGHPMRRRPTPLFPPLDKGGRKRSFLGRGGWKKIRLDEWEARRAASNEATSG